MLKVINSVQNNYIKFLNTLQSKKHILSEGLCLIESDKIVLECINNNLVSVQKVLVTNSKLKLFDTIRQTHKKIEFVIISDEVANKLSNTMTTTGVFAVAELPKLKIFDANQNFLVLDNVQDPTNLGAIIRSAIAFDYKQIILIDSVYSYTSKVIRASMGYVFKTNIVTCAKSDFLELAKQKNLNLICAKASGTDITEANISSPHGLVLGNEGNGVSAEIENICQNFIAIKMQNSVESLNVSVSASIIMHELSKK